MSDKVEKAEKADKKSEKKPGTKLAKKGGLTTAEEQRKALFESMTESTKEVARDFDGMLTKAATGLVMIRYDIGARMIKVTAEEAKYGSNAAEQLATYLNIPGGASTLYSLKLLASTFDRDFVKNQAAIPMVSGRQLDVGHFIVISRVKNKTEQHKLFTRVRQNNMTVNSLEEEVRAAHEPKNKRSGGRKPQMAGSPAANLQKLFTMCQKLCNYATPFGDSVLSELEGLAPDQVNSNLMKKFTEAREQLEETSKECDSILELMRPVEERLQGILAGEEADSEVEADDADVDVDVDDEPVEEKPVATKAAGKKSGNKDKKSSKGPKGSKGGKASRSRPAAV